MHPNHLIADCAQASYLGKTLDIPSLHQKSFGMSLESSGMAARFEEKTDEPETERHKRVVRFIEQGKQQCIEELKKNLEEKAAGQEIDKEMLETEINRVKDEWWATFEELITKGSQQTP